MIFLRDWILLACGMNPIWTRKTFFNIWGEEKNVWIRIKKTRNFHPLCYNFISFEYMMIVMYAINGIAVWTEPFVRRVKLLSCMFDAETFVRFFPCLLFFCSPGDSEQRSMLHIRVLDWAMNWKHKLRCFGIICASIILRASISLREAAEQHSRVGEEEERNNSKQNRYHKN